MIKIPHKDLSLPADGKPGKYVKATLKCEPYYRTISAIRHDSAEKRTKSQLQAPWALERVLKKLMWGKIEII